MVGRKTEKTRLQRSVAHIQATMRQMRHNPIEVQVQVLNQLLRGRYAYYGMAGNVPTLLRVYRATET